jgi:hypothetical protein
VRREIDDRQAAVVRRIFQLCAAGQGTRRIAKTLNSENAIPARPQRGRPKGWTASSVCAILGRSAYRGELVWGKAQKRNSWGQVRFQRCPEEKWIEVAVPDLRIVDDALWDAAYERLRTSRANYLRHTDGQLWGKPANGVESHYLLTGMAICGTCGGNLLIRSRSHGRRRAYYGCPRNLVNGCTNDVEIPMEMADAAVLDIVEGQLLTRDVIELALDKLLQKAHEPAEDVDATHAHLKDALGHVEQELANFTTAIAEGGALRSLLDAVKERERRRVSCSAS